MVKPDGVQRGLVSFPLRPDNFVLLFRYCAINVSIIECEFICVEQCQIKHEEIELAMKEFTIFSVIIVENC